MMDQHILDEQMTYYRKMAQEYDATTGQAEDLLDDIFFFLQARRKAS